jgi:hypothetical protein
MIQHRNFMRAMPPECCASVAIAAALFAAFLPCAGALSRTHSLIRQGRGPLHPPLTIALPLCVLHRHQHDLQITPARLGVERVLLPAAEANNTSRSDRYLQPRC